jgi:hypothetical protein
MRRRETTVLSIVQRFSSGAFSVNLIDMFIPNNPAFSLDKSSHVMPNSWLFATHPKVVVHLHVDCEDVQRVHGVSPIGSHPQAKQGNVLVAPVSEAQGMEGADLPCPPALDRRRGRGPRLCRLRSLLLTIRL